MQPTNRDRRVRSGLSLIEVVIATALAGLLATCLAGLMASAHAAAAQTLRIESARLQHRVLASRLSRAVERCGSYKLPAAPSRFGLRVTRVDGESAGPAGAVVCWTGGRDGDRTTGPTATTLPPASEVLVFAPDPSDGKRFGEISFPTATGTIDFSASDASFRQRINGLVRSSDAEFAPLCDDVVHSTGAGVAIGYGGPFANTGSSTPTRFYGRDVVQNPSDPARAGQMTAVSFELRKTPGDSEIEAARLSGDPGRWDDLPWHQNDSTATSGRQHVWLAFEVQYDATKDATTDAGYPLFGAVERTVTHEVP